jgi:hypothetical protein
MERDPSPEQLTNCHLLWEAKGPAAVAEALSSGAMNPLIDVHPLNTRSYAKAWLVDHMCRTKARERLTLAMAVISAIAAIRGRPNSRVTSRQIDHVATRLCKIGHPPRPSLRIRAAFRTPRRLASRNRSFERGWREGGW